MRIFSKHYHPPGTEPGTLRSVAAEVPFSIKLVDFSHGEYEERALATVAECRPFLDRATTTWIHVQGSVPPATLHELGDLLDLHLLALEDVLNKGQRAKAEEYEEQVFVVMQLPVLNQGDRVVAEQVSLFAGEGFLRLLRRRGRSLRSGSRPAPAPGGHDPAAQERLSPVCPGRQHR